MDGKKNIKNWENGFDFIEVTVLFTGFIAATYGFGVYLFSAVIPDMKVDLQFTYTEAGWMISVAQVGFLLAALTSSLLADIVGAKRLILIAIFACFISLSGLMLVTNKWQIYLFLTIAGAAAAAVWVPMVAVAQDLIPDKHQGKVIGLMSSGTAYGLFVNSLTLPILLPKFGWRSVWFFAAVLTFLLLIWGLIRISKFGGNGSKQSLALENPSIDSEINTAAFFRLICQSSSIKIFVIMFLGGVACMPAQNYLISYLREDLGYEVAMAGYAWSFIGLIGMTGGFVMGALADKISVQKSLTVTFVLLGVATGLFLYHETPNIVYVGSAIFGLAFNAIFGLVPAYVSLNFSRSAATQIFGLATVLLGVGSMVGNLSGGIIYDRFNSFSLIFQISTGSALLLALLSLTLKSSNKS